MMVIVEAYAVRRRAEDRYRVAMGQLSEYFNLLIRLAERASREQQAGLFDRIELTMAEMKRRRLSRVRLWQQESQRESGQPARHRPPQRPRDNPASHQRSQQEQDNSDEQQNPVPRERHAGPLPG
jgi:hypothetical protein